MFVCDIDLFSNFQVVNDLNLGCMDTQPHRFFYKDDLFSVNGFYQFYALIKLINAFS